MHVWNMAEDKINFVIRKKLQNPFWIAGDKSYWENFRDPSPERLAYEALMEGRYLRSKLKSIAKK